ncbi:hypothetical protein BHE74_00035531, partial [Ensete ventricosum]
IEDEDSPEGGGGNSQHGDQFPQRDGQPECQNWFTKNETKIKTAANMQFEQSVGMKYLRNVEEKRGKPYVPI